MTGWKVFAELAGLCHQSQAGWCQILFTPGKISSISSCRFRLEPEHSLSWHFDPRAQTLSVSFIKCQDFALWCLLMMISYICCADLMEQSPEIQESSIAVFHWCEDREFGVFKSWEALRRRQSKEGALVKTSSLTTSIFDYTSVCKENNLQGRNAEVSSAEWSRKSFEVKARQAQCGGAEVAKGSPSK